MNKKEIFHKIKNAKRNVYFSNDTSIETAIKKSFEGFVEKALENCIIKLPFDVYLEIVTQVTIEGKENKAIIYKKPEDEPLFELRLNDTIKQKIINSKKQYRHVYQ